MPLALFRDRTFAIGCVLSVVTMFVFFAIMFYLTFFFQGLQGRTAIATGLAMLPLTAIFTIASPLAGWTTERLGSRGTVLIGAGAITASLLILLGLDTDSSVLSLAPALLLAGAGAGFLLVPAINLVVGSAPEAQSGVASGIQQATQQLGGTLGIAVFGSIISSIVAQTFAPKPSGRPAHPPNSSVTSVPTPACTRASRSGFPPEPRNSSASNSAVPSPARSSTRRT